MWLWHAVRLADLADLATDLVTSFESEVGADAPARFHLVNAEDRVQARWWWACSPTGDRSPRSAIKGSRFVLLK